MNRIFDFAALLAALPLVLAGCVAEDRSDCPPEMNVTLHFRLPDHTAPGGCSFMEKITTATTAIYNDATGEMIESITTFGTHHSEFQGLRLRLDPGTYRVVSWGNSGGGTRMNDHHAVYTHGHGHICYSDITDGMACNGDALYYAPNSVKITREGRRTRQSSSQSGGNDLGEYIMVVDPQTGHEGTLDYRHAHRHIEVFVKGFSGSDGSSTPVIRLNGLPEGLTFLGMERHGENLVSSELASQMVSVGIGGRQGEFALSPFRVFYLHAGDYNIGVDVIDPATGELAYSTMLNDHIDEEDDDPENEVTIQLLIEFKGAHIEVSIPSWDPKDIDYGFWD